MSLLDLFTNNSKPWSNVYVHSVNTPTVNCDVLNAGIINGPSNPNIVCQTVNASTSVTTPTVNATNVLASGAVQAGSMLTNSLVSNSFVQTPTVNTVNLTASNLVDTQSLAAAVSVQSPIVRATNIQGIGAGTPQVSLVRVATLGDPLQKVNNIWAANIGSQASKTNVIHATNLHTSFLNSLSSPVTEGTIATLTTYNAINAYQGITISGYTLDDFYKENQFTLSLASSFFNSTYDINAHVYGIQQSFTIEIDRFDIRGGDQTGNDGVFEFQCPHLKDWQLSGTIPFSTSNDPNNYNLAIFDKEAGSGVIMLRPINFKHFEFVLYAGQDLYFKAGQVHGARF